MYTKFTDVVMIFMIIIVQKTINGQRCERILSSEEVESYCCNNHEDINGTCDECKDGYISESGEACQQCKGGSYGRKCAHSCACAVNERCHHKHGCVEITDHTTTDRSGFKTLPKYEYFTTETVRSTSYIHVDNIAFFYFGLSKREVIVYSVGIAGCSFGVLMCIVVFRRYKRRFYRQTVETTEPLSDNSVIMNEIPGDGIENLYEMIDESNMELELNSNVNQSDQNLGSGSEPDQKNSRSSSSSTSTNSDDITSMGNNSYLNPYQPIVSDNDPHVYISVYEQSMKLSSSSSEEEGATSTHKNCNQEELKDLDPNKGCNSEKDTEN